MISSVETHAAQREYEYRTALADHTQLYLWKPVLRYLGLHANANCATMRVLDLGCGNGAFTGELASQGYSTIGIDPSESGIRIAQQNWPKLAFHVGSSEDDLSGKYGKFDAVVSLEVVEHVYSPSSYAAAARALLVPGGVAIFSTPFHGYWKNLALAVTGSLDAHFTALWEHGHIKFWSRRTITKLLEGHGFEIVQFGCAGRFTPFWKSMIVVARRGGG